MLFVVIGDANNYLTGKAQVILSLAEEGLCAISLSCFFFLILVGWLIFYFVFVQQLIFQKFFSFTIHWSNGVSTWDFGGLKTT